jgi:hypothetical protein
MHDAGNHCGTFSACTAHAVDELPAPWIVEPRMPALGAVHLWTAHQVEMPVSE